MANGDGQSHERPLHPTALAMVIDGIDTERIEAAVFDLGGVFLAGGV